MRNVTIQFRAHTCRAVLAAALLGCALLTPSIALANNISSAFNPALGGEVAVTIPADSHQVYQVHVAAGDWLIGYSWVPGTNDATASIRVLSPLATDVASETVATSSANGVLYWQAPSAGDYYCDYTGDPGTRLSRGLFLSRPRLWLGGSSTILVPYNGAASLLCGFADDWYSYVPYDGPWIGFEPVGLSSSADGLAYKRVYSGSTDVNGRLIHTVTGVARKTFFRFDYTGSIYSLAGFGHPEVPRHAVSADTRQGARVFRSLGDTPAQVRRRSDEWCRGGVQEGEPEDLHVHRAGILVQVGLHPDPCGCEAPVEGDVVRAPAPAGELHECRHDDEVGESRCLIAPATPSDPQCRWRSSPLLCYVHSWFPLSQSPRHHR